MKSVVEKGSCLMNGGWMLAALLASRLLASAAASDGNPPAAAATGERWVAIWEAAPQLVEPANLPPAPGLDGSTLRQVIHLTLAARQKVAIMLMFGVGAL